MDCFTTLRERIRALSDDALRSEYVSASRVSGDWIDAVIALECIQEARRRSLPLRTRDETIRAMLAAMEGY